MNYYYKVQAQFAKAGAPSFYTDGYKELLEEAKNHFNRHSFVSSNPRQIIECGIIDDNTIGIRFWSEKELNINQISRSLRSFTEYLIDEKHSVNFLSLITGRRLFRMKGERENYIKENEEVKYNSDIDQRFLKETIMNKLKILEWNINCRNDKKVDIQPFVVDEILKKEPDVIVLTEFVKSENWKEFIYSFTKYNVIISSNTLGNGVLIAVKKEIEITDIVKKIPFVSKYNSPDFLQVGIKYKDTILKIIGTRIRIDDGGDEDYKHRKKQFEVLTNYLSDFDNTIIIGDFNNSYIRGDQNKSYSNGDIQKIYKKDNKGKLLNTRFYNYHLLKNMLGEEFILHTPTDKYSWGLQYENKKLKYGYIENDHLIVRNNIKVSTVFYSWDFIESNVNKENIFNIYCNENNTKKKKDGGGYDNSLVIPKGYPDHAMLVAEIGV